MDLSSISAANKVDVTLNENVLETTVTDCVAPSDSIQMNVDKNPQLHDWVVKDKKDTLKHSTPYVRVDVSKPSTSKISPTKSKDECLQTTLIRICSRGVQTDDELPSSNDKLVECKSLQTEKSMPVNSNSASGSSSSKTGSFKYIRGSDFATTKTSLSSRSTTSSERNVSEKSTTSNVQKSSSSRSTPQSSIINSPLGKIISSQHSNHLIADIDKSLYILQHFIKSKNYNPETKQYYAKKIVSKIIESRYIDDSTSISNTSVNTSNKSSTHNNSEKKLSPKSTETYVSKTSKNTATKSITKSLDNLQTPSIVNETSKNNSCPTSRIDLKNWREEKTLSEKILDEREKILKHRSTGSKSVTPSVKYSDDNDYLIQHSKKERKRQISWINHELSYLQKLKDLLQTKNTGRTSNNFSCHNSENSDSVLRGSGDHNSYHSNSEIEDRFRKIFGSLKHSPTPEDMDKLSKYLTTDQIKYLIDNEAKKLHCPKCECCTNQTQSLKLNINESNNDEDSHTHGESYNSHSHNIYKDLVTPKTASKEAVSAPVLEKQKDVDETILNNNKNDVSIQCTLKKRKKGKEISTATTETTTESISVLEDKNIQTTSSDIIKEPIQTFYENPQDLTVTDSTKCSSESEKIEMLRKMTLKSPKRGKANIEKRRKPHKFLKSSMAYYLTFEEDSQHEMSLDEKSSLERVTVKIPKFKYRRNHVIEEQTRRPDSERSKTLQVLLCFYYNVFI